MHNLTPITALGGAEPQVDSHGGVTLTERPDTALASVAARMGRETDAAAALATLIGADAPAVSRFSGGTIRTFWAGPDQWMVEAPFATHETIATDAKAALGGAASVTEQTDAWVRFDLEGDGVLAVLELLCALNTRGMTAGDVSRTAIHHLGCFVLCEGPTRFTLYGPRASAGSLHHAAVAAIRAAL